MSILPTPLSIARRVARVLRSNLSPSQVAAAFALGIFAGLPPLGLHIILPITVALLLRCSFSAFLLSMAAFRLLSLAMAPLAFIIGRWLLDTHRGLDALWRWMFHLPVLAPMGYGRYLLFGSLILSLVLAIPVFFAVRWIVRRYREQFFDWIAGHRLTRRLQAHRGLRAVKRALIGEAAFATVPPPRGLFRFVRKRMLIAIPVIYAGAYLIAAAVVPFFAGTLMTSTASWIVGTEVSVDAASFSLFSGGLRLQQFTIRDAANPSENLIEIPEVTLDAGMMALLEKRVVFDRVSISDAALHVVREADGTLNLDDTAAAWSAGPYLDWAAEHAADLDWIGLFERFFDALPAFRLPPRGDPYAPYRGGRSLPAFRPPFVVRHIEIGRLLVTLDDRARPADSPPTFDLLELRVSNLAFPAELRTKPMEIELVGRLSSDPEARFALATRFGAGAGGTFEGSFSAQRVDLSSLAAMYDKTLAVRIPSGRATFEGNVRIDSKTVTGHVSLLLEGLKLTLPPGASLFGLSAETSAAVIEGLNRYALEVPIVLGIPIGGTPDEVDFSWEAPLLERAREGLVLLGRRELDGVIEQLGLRVDALGGVDAGALSPSYAALQQEAERTMGEILRKEAPASLLQRLPLRLREPDAAEDGAPAPNALESLIQGLFDAAVQSESSAP